MSGEPPAKSARVGALAVLASAGLFGTSATSRAIIYPGSPATGTAAARLLVGAVGLLVVAGRRSQGRSAVLRMWRQPVIWAMGLAVAAYQVLFFIGASRAGVAVGTLASLALAPFMAGVLGWLMREGAPGVVWAVSTIVAVIGLALLTLIGSGTHDLLGVLAAVGAGTAYAVYTVLGVRFARGGEQPTCVLAASFSIAAVLCLPFLVMDGSWLMSPRGIALALWLGLATTTLGYVLFGIGLGALKPGTIATLNLAEPVVATVLGVLVLGESLSATGWVGCALIIVALAILGLDVGRDRQESTA